VYHIFFKKNHMNPRLLNSIV